MKTSVVEKKSSEPTRGQRIWTRMLEHRGSGQLSLARARLITAAYKDNEGLPVPVKRAKAFEMIVTGIPIFIEDEQLLAGDYSAIPNGAEAYPETAVNWMLKEIADHEENYDVAAGEIEEQKAICEFWKTKCFEYAVHTHLGEERKQKLSEITETGAYVWFGLGRLERFKGHHAVDYSRVVNRGFLAIIADCEKEMAATPVLDLTSLHKVAFLQGLIIEYKASILYAQRYAELARQMAATAPEPRRKELLRIAEVCDRVPAYPARNFYEAVQAMWFVHVLIQMEVRSLGASPGRVDQYLYPYYKHDIQSGKITREEAIELLECVRCKTTMLRTFSIKSYREALSGEAQFHNFVIGGQTADGKDATNEVSYLFMEAAFRTRTPHNTLSVRIHDGTPDDFALKALELSAQGNGYPAFFGDRTAISFLTKQVGCSVEEARGYAVGGCVIPHIPGKTGPSNAAFNFSVAKVLDITLHNGFDTYTKKQIGPKTGALADFKSYDDFLAAFYKQLEYFFETAREYFSLRDVYEEEMLPPLFYSGLTDNCIKEGGSSIGRGAAIRWSTANLIGVIDVGDSLAAIKKCVFEDGSVSKKELLQALDANFEGMQSIHKKLKAAPKYGNDDDYVDCIVHDLCEGMRDRVERLSPTIFGVKKFYMRIYSHSYHIPTGKRVGALPSGRLSGDSLVDGGISPSHGCDVNGPTAVINSATKIELDKIQCTLMNMKFMPSTLKTKDDLKKLLALLKTYFQNGGYHIQFNVVDRATLVAAQAHPQLHRSLIVRVAGYSALFVELDRGVQDEIIRRTAHAL